MIRIAVFFTVLIGVCLYAMWRGGAPERVAGVMMAAAAVLTALLPVVPGVTFHIVEVPRLATDIALLAGLLVVTAYADRFWPIYCTGLHLLAVATHGVRAIDPHVLPIVYTRVTGWLGYPVLLILLIGTWRHVGRVRRHGREFDWTHQRRRHSDDGRAVQVGAGGRRN